MDQNFFNHLGPFFETTPKGLTENSEQITEKIQVLPKAINSNVKWEQRKSAPEKKSPKSPIYYDFIPEQHPPIYDENLSYYQQDIIEADDSLDYSVSSIDYEYEDWKPFHPSHFSSTQWGIMRYNISLHYVVFNGQQIFRTFC